VFGRVRLETLGTVVVMTVVAAQLPAPRHGGSSRVNWFTRKLGCCEAADRDVSYDDIAGTR
jgi:hypothetical protein